MVELAHLRSRIAELEASESKQKQTAEALRGSETQYRRLFEAARDGILILDAETGEISAVNPFLTNLLGYSEQEILGRKLWEIGPFKDKRVSKIAFQELQTQEYIRYEDLPLETKDGTSIAVEFISSVYRADQKKVIQCNIRDITERKRAEEAAEEAEARLVAILEATPDLVSITDLEGRLLYLNRAGRQMLGLDERVDLTRYNLQQFHDAANVHMVLTEGIPTAMREGVWSGETALAALDGHAIPVSQVILAHKSPTGAVEFLSTIARDITTQNRAAEARVRLEAQYRQAQKMESVGQLASGIAHDFNNLLTVINGMSELVLARVSQDDPVHADVQEIHRAGERAATLTRQLLAFSRQQILEPRVMSINTVVTGMESLLRRLLGEDIDLAIVLARDLGHVKVDRGQIEQAIANLAVNARDAMPRGGQLTIQTHSVKIDEGDARRHDEAATPAGPYVTLSVSDSGVGMDEATRARIFEPFFTTKGPGKGTGLGLSTVEGIVTQSHGFMRVHSEVGSGTLFEIYLPEVTEAAGAERLEPTVVPSGGTETILLVEDDAGLRKLATRLLEPAGYTVLGAASGEEALRLLERHERSVHLLISPVHLLLSDVVLPGISGRSLAEQVVQNHPRMKVLYMSGYTSDTIVRHGLLEARVAFLNKPFTAAALLRKVRESLDS